MTREELAALMARPLNAEERRYVAECERGLAAYRRRKAVTRAVTVLLLLLVVALWLVRK